MCLAEINEGESVQPERAGVDEPCAMLGAGSVQCNQVFSIITVAYDDTVVVTADVADAIGCTDFHRYSWVETSEASQNCLCSGQLPHLGFLKQVVPPEIADLNKSIIADGEFPYSCQHQILRNFDS